MDSDSERKFLLCHLCAGKLKPKTEEKTSSGNKKIEDETSVSQVDQIKMKYGYANTTNDVSAYNSFMHNFVEKIIYCKSYA